MPATVAAPVASAEPTVVTRYDDGAIKREVWRVDDRLHRVDGPAVVWYHTDGSVEYEEWWVDGSLHRVDGPAYVRYHPDGTIKSEAWYVDGEKVDGPAQVLVEFLRSRCPDITTGAATFLSETHHWQEWGEISDAEIELAMTLYPDYAEA